MSEEKKEQKTQVKKAAPKKEEKKGVKYIVRDDLGFEKRNYFIPGTNERVLLEAGAEVDEKTYNRFSSHCKQVFFKKK